MKANTHVSARRTQAHREARWGQRPLQGHRSRRDTHGEHRTAGYGQRLSIGLLAALLMLMQLVPAGLAPENAMGGGAF